MVDSALLRQLEMEGMEYKNAFKVCNLMETEGISLAEAKRRVTKQIMDAEKKKTIKTDKPYVSVVGNNSNSRETAALDPKKWKSKK